MVRIEFEKDFSESLKDHRFLIVFFLLFIVFLVVNFSGNGVERVEGCEIIYGDSECIEGDIVTGFYNPNRQDIDSVSVHIPTDEGENIYDVESNLPSQETRVLRTGGCDDQQKEGMEVEWCCGDICLTEKMENPSKEIDVE